MECVISHLTSHTPHLYSRFAQVPNARLGHVQASLAAALALCICHSELVAGQEQHAVLAAKAEAVGQGVLEVVTGVLVGAHVQMDAFVLIEHVPRGMNHLVLQGLHGNNSLESAGGT